MKVCKFGGTSMADAEAINRVAEIIASDKTRKFVVVSAPGRRNKTDEKITDLFYAAHKEAATVGDCSKTFAKIADRFNTIVKELNLKLDLTNQLERIKHDIDEGAGKDYAASRGEYLTAIVMAARLGYSFVDAQEIIKFYDDGTFDAEYTNDMTAARLENSSGAVIPGFYGRMPGGEVKTFSRGGSDVTGAIIARAVGASVYENWTDVNGFMVCDPRIVDNPALIKTLTYKELRELSYMGAEVLHPESIFPVRKSDIPINIRNTFEPSNEGTMIIPTGSLKKITRTITGIAGKKDFLAITVEKSMMNGELGFARKLLSVLEHYQISIEHMPTGIDTITFILDSHQLDDETLAKITERMRSVVHADNIEVIKGLAMLAVVGHGMKRKKGTAARIFASLGRANVNVRMIDQGSSELNLIVGVENADYEKAITAIYSEFIH